MAEMFTKLKRFSPSDGHCDSALWLGCQESERRLKNAVFLQGCKSASRSSGSEADGEWGGRITEKWGASPLGQPDNTQSPTEQSAQFCDVGWDCSWNWKVRKLSPKELQICPLRHRL